MKCAPPANRPTAGEESNCSTWLVAELRALIPFPVLVTLGGVAFGRVLRLAPTMGWGAPTPRPRFGHGVEVALDGGPVVMGCYHPSQQNTFTGRLTPAMIDTVFAHARRSAIDSGR